MTSTRDIWYEISRHLPTAELRTVALLCKTARAGALEVRRNRNTPLDKVTKLKTDTGKLSAAVTKLTRSIDDLARQANKARNTPLTTDQVATQLSNALKSLS
jgi:uncharacterized coiled-coil DUF342 family protein